MSESSKLLPTVVDTNLFVSGTIVKRGPPFALLEAWRRRAFRLLLSDEQHVELLDVFRRPSIVINYNVSPDELVELFDGFAKATRVVLTPTLPIPVRDPKDEKILAAAIGGRAAFLVTGDKDLLVLRGHPDLGVLRIVTAVEFLAVLADREQRRLANADPH